VADNPYAPSLLPGQQPNIAPSAGAAYAPPATLAPAAPAAAPATYAPSPMTAADVSHAILHHESGNNPNVRTSPQGAVGIGQILPATAAPYTLPGENLHNPADNLAIHNRIIADYMRRYNGDPARVAVAYFSGPGNVAPPGSPTPWISNKGDVNQRVSQYVADTVGKGGGFAGASHPVSAAPAAPTSAAQNFADAYKSGNMGGMLAALTQKDSDNKKSALDNLAEADKPQQAQAPQQQPMLPQAAPPPDVAGPSQQLFGQILAQQAKPLSWSSAPFGANAGPQVPGTTLNSASGYG
jgi:hypothetical protein